MWHRCLPERVLHDEWQKFGVDVSEHAVEIARSAGIEIKMGEAAYDYENVFDVIVMRGSLQHLPDPFQTIARCKECLNPTGCWCFSTPNTNSPYFRRWHASDPHRDAEHLQPSDTMMVNALQNMGFRVLNVRYPYLETPYANVIMDHVLFLLSYLGVVEFAFWKSAMKYAKLRVAPDRSTGQ